MSLLAIFDSTGVHNGKQQVAMNSKLVALVLIVALVVTGVGGGLAVLLSG